MQIDSTVQCEPFRRSRGRRSARTDIPLVGTSHAEHPILRVLRHRCFPEAAMVTPSDIQVLLLLATYFTLTRAQIGRLAFPDDRDGRATRRHLQKLLNQRLVQRTRMEVVNPAMGAPAPVYYLTGDGAGFLAQQLQDEKYLSCCTQAPNWQHLYHWCAVAEFHIELDRAVVQSADVRVSHWFGEWDVLDPAAREPERHFRLYTRLSDKLVCVPDAAFELER